MEIEYLKFNKVLIEVEAACEKVIAEAERLSFVAREMERLRAFNASRTGCGMPNVRYTFSRAS